jgi:hypothetical protein
MTADIKLDVFRALLFTYLSCVKIFGFSSKMCFEQLFNSVQLEVFHSKVNDPPK